MSQPTLGHSTPTAAAASSQAASAAAANASTSSSSSLLATIQQNRKTLLIAGGALVVAGAGAYYYLSTREKLADIEKSAGGSSSEKGGKKKKKKSNKKGGAGAGGGEKRPLGVNDEGGPLVEEIPLEERKDSKEAAAAPEGAASEPVSSAPAGETKKDDLPNPSASEIAAMGTSERTDLANLLKSRGNLLFSKKDYTQAISFYTRAIAVTPEESAVFYSNRAASYNSLTPPQHDKVIEDCGSALKLDPAYLKALKRRASALESLDRDEEAVRDYTAVTLLEAFEPPKRSATGKDVVTGEILERVLKKMATREAKELMATRPPQLPSATFINAYLDAFRPHPAPTLPEAATQADKTLLLSFEALEAGDHKHAFTLAQEALEQGITWPQGKAEALNLRGTFKFLINDRDGAKEDLEESIALCPELVQSRIKLASVHMELGNISDTFGDFEAAIAQNPNDPDIYYHRGQVYFIADDLEKALADYSKSVELDTEFIFSHIQKAVTQYRMQNTSLSMSTFRGALKQFPERSEPYNYYGELLLAEGRFQDAVEKFDKAIEIESAKEGRRRNVLPMVNKANCLLRWKEDFGACERLIREALKIDPDCDVAIITLAQISLQQSKVEQAVEMFRRAKEIARSEEELVQAITFEEASKAQILFMKNYPAQHKQMTAIMAQHAASQQ